MTKVLVSHGYGAGWATWNDKSKAVAEYRPIIEFIEGGGSPADLDTTLRWYDGKCLPESRHPLIRQMVDELGLSSFYAGGASGLTVETVDGPYMIDEYDGSESIVTSIDFW